MKKLRDIVSFIREQKGVNLDDTLHKATAALADANIPHYVGGGYAVQHHGYPRFTGDVDIIVPHDMHAAAHDKLSISGFRPNPGSSMSLTDRSNKISEIDLLHGGKSMGKNGYQLPMPTSVSAEPNILPLNTLLHTKFGAGRAKDHADAVELIKANKLPHDYITGTEHDEHYKKAWDMAQKEMNEET
jgi:hypothetical protein